MSHIAETFTTEDDLSSRRVMVEVTDDEWIAIRNNLSEFDAQVEAIKLLPYSGMPKIREYVLDDHATRISNILDRKLSRRDKDLQTYTYVYLCLLGRCSAKLNLKIPTTIVAPVIYVCLKAKHTFASFDSTQSLCLSASYLNDDWP